VRTRDLPGQHPIAMAIKNTVLPATTRSLGNGDCEILQHKEKTQLQGIKRRQNGYTGLAKPECKALLQDYSEKSWEKHYQKAKERSKHRAGNYFQKYPWHPNYSIQARCKRQTSSAYYALKLGHGFFKSYSKRLGHATSDLCRCGSVETPEHLLLSCPNYNFQRPQCLKRGTPLAVLLQEKTEREDVIQFIQQTKIGTRQWHLSRLIDENADESVEESREEALQE
jgi:hypothetical protein